MMTAEQLKNSILQLAVQGKLVEQRPEEGTGEDLYTKIQNEKKKMVLEGKLKNQKKLPCIQESDIPFDIPANWKWVRLGEITELTMGQSPKGDKVFEGGEGIEFHQGKIYFSEDYLQKSPQTTTEPTKLVEADTVLLCVRAPVGIVNITQRKICIGRGLCGVNTLGQMDSVFMLNWLRAIRDSFVKKATGTTFIAITGKVVQEELIPLPPLEEQKRIVAKIEELMPFVEQYAEASTKLNTLNASFPDMMKKSILQEAVQGKLVPHDPNDEPASELLKRIAEEKKRLIKEGKIKKDKNISRIVCDGRSWFEFLDGKKVCIDSEIPFEVPSNWAWVRLNELGDYKKGPFGSALTKSMFVPAGSDSVKVYEQKNAIQKDWTLGEYYIRRAYYEDKMIGFTVEPGDVIVSCAGTIGETYIMPENIDLGIINQALMRMKIYEPMNVAYFLMYFDYVIKASAREQSKGSAIKNIPPFSVFKQILFPVPPLAEQKRILEKLSELMTEIDKLIV